ncbi:MAG: hypothetical protein ABIW34_02840 [Ginsengibacter sp.]
MRLTVNCLLLLWAFQWIMYGCQQKSAADFTEGEDYAVYQLTRMMDTAGFNKPVEAYSLLLPKDWTHTGEVEWKVGTSCDGTNSWLKAFSNNKKNSFEIFRPVTFGWSDDAETKQFMEKKCGGVSQPMKAEEYLRKVFAPQELGGPEILKVETNNAVIEQMGKNDERIRNEQQQNGTGKILFYHSAVSAYLRWPDGGEGIVVLGVSTMGGEIPNNYNGTISKLSTTTVSPRIVFKYPAGKEESAKNQFAVLMGSFKTNTAWHEAVDNIWKENKKENDWIIWERNIGNDSFNFSMHNRAIQNGNNLLNQMDTGYRNWEMHQSSQDQIHTNFIKSIRDVQNFQDQSGKYEMTSPYDHAWSRDDGRTFVMSNNPNFDPQFVFQDQSWKEMKKVN